MNAINQIFFLPRVKDGEARSIIRGLSRNDKNLLDSVIVKILNRQIPKSEPPLSEKSMTVTVAIARGELIANVGEVQPTQATLKKISDGRKLLPNTMIFIGIGSVIVGALGTAWGFAGAVQITVVGAALTGIGFVLKRVARASENKILGNSAKVLERYLGLSNLAEKANGLIEYARSQQ